MLSLLAVVVLSGPVWEKLPLPVFKKQSALVVALDLSRSMDAEDLKPSRLARARLKLMDLLNSIKEGQVALVAYAATAYPVTPLTDDTATIQSLVSSLETDIMPAQGSRADRAVDLAVQLLRNAGQSRGDILLITDWVSDEAFRQLQNRELSGFRLSVLAVGSEQGAPIPLPSGGFVKDSQGSIVLAVTDMQRMRTLSSLHGGIFSKMTIDDSDLEQLRGLLAIDHLDDRHTATDLKADRWLEYGPWLLLLITPLAALAFRRGVLLSALLAVLLLPVVPSVEAQESGFDWQQLWKNDNQRAQQALEQGQAQQAAQLFDEPEWKAAAYYRAGDYEQSLAQLEQIQDTESEYNRGNALAQLGRYQEALDSYDRVLQQQPEHEDAAYNRQLVEQALKQQQQQQQQQSSRSDQERQGEGQQQQQDQQQAQSEQSDPQPGQSQESQSQAGQQQPDASQKATDSKDQQQAAQANQSDAVNEQARNEPGADDQQQPAQNQQSPTDEEKQAARLSDTEQDTTDDLSSQVEQQWLRRIVDDPGGLLRNKFRYLYSQQPGPQETETW
jgi:Ca-activated chloride channel family protein